MQNKLLSATMQILGRQNNHNMYKQCKICSHSADFPEYTAKEMMLGTRHEFSYFQCNSCGCLQILDTPKNIGDYYPDNYYSFNKKASSKIKYRIRSWIDNQRVNDILFSNNRFGRFANSVSKPLDYAPWIKNHNVSKSTRILDIGCGDGRLLSRMAMSGFKQLYGVDPYMGNSENSIGLNLYKVDLAGFFQQQKDLTFDLIMLHHSLEHMTNPLEILKYCQNHITNKGVILVRVPLVDSYAWEKYREQWVQLDAPRHLFLFSVKSIKYLAESAGLIIKNIDYDSSKFQFVGSELYKRDITLNADKKAKNIFSSEQIREFQKTAQKLNEEKRGDQAAFYLAKP